jgi:hypothetical protein
MNCDQVFDILTRGPFPSGAASDGSVQRHLSGCAECRQLAEALRPALDLIHESVPPEESWGLPGYWEDVPPGEQPVTVKQRPQLAVRRMRLPNDARRDRVSVNERWRLAAVAAIAGALAAVAVLGVERVNERRPSVALPGQTTATVMPIAWPPENCGHEVAAIATTAGQLQAELRSCRECHSQGQAHYWIESVTPTEWATELATTCFKCHELLARK